MRDRELTARLPLGNDTLGLIVLLERHALWLSSHEAGADAAVEIAEWAREVKRTATPERREWMPLGVCPLEVERDSTLACGGQVRAYPERDPHCTDCGTEAVATWWERVMFPDCETTRLITSDEIVLVVHREFGKPVKAATIRQWIRRGLIESSGTDDRGRTLYDRGAVVYAVAKWTRISA